MGIPQETEETVDSYCYTKVWRVKPVYQQMTLSPWWGDAGIFILWHIIANTDIYKCSFLPQAIRDWNALPDSLISSAECVDDGVAKFTSLVREGLVSLVLVNDCHSVNNSDSDSEHYQEIGYFSYLILNFNMYNII